MSVEKNVIYTLVCDECDEISEEYHYGQREAEEFKGRGTRYARTRASQDGWTAFSERDLCPEHSHKNAR